VLIVLHLFKCTFKTFLKILIFNQKLQ
jgi:hypothetical protein